MKWKNVSTQGIIILILIVSNVAKSGGEVTLNQFVDKAKEVCATGPNPAEPFMCMDLIYISVLLKDAYGLDKKTKIKVIFHLFIPNNICEWRRIILLLYLQLYRTVNGHQVTWALGCAYNLLDGMTRSKKDSDNNQTSTNCWKSLFKKIKISNYFRNKN